MEKSQSIVNIAKSLIEFQKKVGKIKKDSTNPFLGKKYASLSNILDQISGPLTECGLAITQFPSGEAGLLSILMHGESGEFIQETCDIKNLKEDPQVRGSHISYLRRYALCAILSLNIEDEGGQAASYQPQGGGSQKGQLPWLNKGTQFDEVAKELVAGTTTIDVIKDNFRVSKQMEELLKGEIIKGWASKVNAVKDIKSLTKLYNDKKAEVESSDLIKSLFKARKEQLEASPA